MHLDHKKLHARRRRGLLVGWGLIGTGSLMGLGLVWALAGWEVVLALLVMTLLVGLICAGVIVLTIYED